jgi:transposase
LTSKIHLACDGRGLPLAFTVTAGNINDCTRLIEVVEAIAIRRAGPGRPRTRPGHLIADKGYSTRIIRDYLRRRRIPHTIPERSDQVAARARRGHRRCGFDRDRYRRRNVVERCFNQLKRFRGLATRYEKLAAHYRAVVTIASLVLWLNHDPQNRP